MNPAGPAKNLFRNPSLACKIMQNKT